MSFKDRVIAASKADPVAELAQELFDEGMTEQELADALKDRCFATLGQPFKLNLQNKFRDIIIREQRK